MPAPQVKSQDVLVCLKLHSISAARRPWTYSVLANEVGLSTTGAYSSVRRMGESGVLTGDDGSVKVHRKRLFDLLVQAVPSMFFPRRGEITRGLPTSLGAQPLADLAAKLSWQPDPLPLVWPWQPDGDQKQAVKGETLFPIYKTVPASAARDHVLYELLALVDVVRTSANAREKKLAVDLLEERLCGR